MNDSTPDATKRPAGRMLRVALFVSLAVNLLVAGAVIGALLLRGPDHGPRAQVIDLSFAPYTRAMSADQRAALREAWQAGASAAPAELRAAQRRELEELAAALRESAPQPDRIEAILEHRHHRRSEHARRAVQLLATHFAQMPSEERSAYAERLETLGERGPPHRGPAPR